MTSSMSNEEMQLRSCDQLHFIQAIRDGEVKKVVNVSRGRLTLMFKTLDEIYGFPVTKRTVSTSRTCSRKKLHASQFDPKKVKVEVPDRLNRTDNGPSDFDLFGDVNEGDDDLDDLTLDNMTLSQIKERSQMKKRKRSTSAADNGKNGAGFDDKKGCSNTQLGEDDDELEEPLIKLKSKLRKNIRRGKKKSKKKDVTASSGNAIVVVKTEQTWSEHSSVEPDWDLDLPVPLAIKVEVPEDYHAGHEMMAFLLGDSSVVDNEQEAYYLCAREELKQADEYISDIEGSSPESPFKDTEEDECKSTSREAVLTANTLELRNCLEDLQSEPKEEECIPNGGFGSDADDGSLQSDEERIPILKSSPHIELADAKSPFNIETSSTISSIDESTTLHCDVNPTPGITVSSVSTADGLSLSEDELSQMACVDVAKICLEDIPPSAAVEEHITSERAENKELPKLQHTFRRLFSTRKVISPTSQERLCKSMRSDELSDDEVYKCRGKLYLRAQRAEKIRSVETMEHVKRGELTGNFKKQKPDRIGLSPLGIQKVRQISSLATSRMNAECNSMRSPSENAIAFSQRQMQDIENLTTKLMVELKSVKEIAEEASLSGAGVVTASKYDADEVRARIENATRVEETAKRWLSMMARDCKRFCKIMKFTENGRCAPGTVAQKERKKVRFADEAGRKLHHVQYI
ncbi:uncharacterized protein LOC116192722 [Punica granatum]|uniref:Uncharacterized protein LOC116192722 n=1 Tax=Punica granatum TaxID=22663 RepID=A0A218X8J2_PUNGR|nr:uncharacterized protein LOC116192722 [Punica granatum]OWM80831.1 hypothetical protein CDL15_Pgr006862 [Punica granatum]